MIFYVSILTLVGLYVVQKIAIVRRIHGLQFIVRLPLLIFCFSLGSVMGISCSLYCKLLIPAGSTGKSVDVNQFTGEVFYFLVKHILNIQCRIISSPSHSTLRRAGSPSRAGSSIAITDGSLSSDSSFCNINKKEEVQKMISARVPCVLICNHQSSMDLFCMAFLWPRRLAVIAKESVQYYPLIGWHLKMANNIFIKRSNREKAIETMNEAARKMLEQKVGVFLFPEGTRSHAEEPGMLPFKKGAFHMAVKAQVPIIPIVFVLEPIDTVGKTVDDVAELVDDCRNLMSEALANMRDELQVVN